MIEAVPASSDSIVLIITKVDDPEALDSKFSKFGTVPSDLGSKKKEEEENSSGIRLFSFATMDDVMLAVHFLSNVYSGSSTLYKDHAADMYILAMTQSDHSDKDYSCICNMLTEYGTLENASGIALAFLEEHCETLVSGNAVQTLAAL